MGRKALTQQEVEEHCLEHGYKLLSEYIDIHTKITLQNIETGEIGEMRFRNFRQGRRFDNSKATKKLTQQEVESHCLEHDYRVLSPYVNKKTKITLQNIETGKIGEMLFNSFKKGRRFDTPKNKTKLTQREVEEYCLERGYRVLDKYVNNSTKIKLQNIETGEIGEMRFSNFKTGNRFDNPKTKTKLTYQQYIQPFMDEGYTVSFNEKDYNNINCMTKINVTCLNNHKWAVKRNTFTCQSHLRCPMCNQNTAGGISLGERLVYQILQGNGIAFEREKSILVDSVRYRFDFYFEIEEFGCVDKFFVEYDGEQHYHEKKHFENFEKRRASDEIKDKYARDNNIQMIRIPWLNNTIDKVLFVVNGETGLNLHSVNVDLPTIQEITDYYLGHEKKETMDKFNICNTTLFRYFNQIYGMSKTKYIGTTMDISKQKEVVNYYLSHSLQQTTSEFNISDVTISKYFKQIHGTTKAEYLSTSKQKEVSDYYLTHTLKETSDEFDISGTTINEYFNQIHDMSKRKYLKAIDTTE